jgi:hypothetical protein
VKFTLRQEEILVEAYRDGGEMALGTHRGSRNTLLDRGLFTWDSLVSRYVLTIEGINQARLLAEKRVKR